MLAGTCGFAERVAVRGVRQRLATTEGGAARRKAKHAQRAQGGGGWHLACTQQARSTHCTSLEMCSVARRYTAAQCIAVCAVSAVSGAGACM